MWSGNTVLIQCTMSLQAPVTNGDIGAFGDTTTIMNANLTPFSTEDDFASSIFSQLPPNLQTMLGVGGVGDTQGNCTMSGV